MATITFSRLVQSLGLLCLAAAGVSALKDAYLAPPAVYTDADLCRAGISADFGRPIHIIKARELANGNFYLSYKTPDDGKTWDYDCKVRGDHIVWREPTGRWRDDYAVENRLRYTVSGPGNALLIHITYPDGSTNRKSFSQDEVTATAPLPAMTVGDMRTAIKGFTQLVAMDLVPRSTQIESLSGDRGVSFDHTSLRMTFQGKTYSLIEPADFSEETKDAFMHRLGATGTTTLEEFNTAIDAIALRSALVALSEASTITFVTPFESAPGNILMKMQMLRDEGWREDAIVELSVDAEDIGQFNSLTSDALHTLIGK